MAFPDLFARRELLMPVANPHSRRDHLVRLGGQVVWRGQAVAVTLTYVPDRQSLDPACWPAYLTELGGWSFAIADHLAAAILDDFGNQLVPRWLQVCLALPDQSVLMEDRQPDWDNPSLLARAGGLAP